MSNKAHVEVLQRCYADLLRLQRATLDPPNNAMRDAGLEESIESIKSSLHDFGAAVPCKGCSKTTVGSVGAAGIFWPFLCQKCKDEADNGLADGIRAAPFSLISSHMMVRGEWGGAQNAPASDAQVPPVTYVGNERFNRPEEVVPSPPEEPVIMSSRVLVCQGHLGIKGRNTYECVTQGKAEVSYEFLEKAQNNLGFHPQGYGGPYDANSSINPEGNRVTIWKSPASCD